MCIRDSSIRFRKRSLLTVTFGKRRLLDSLSALMASSPCSGVRSEPVSYTHLKVLARRAGLLTTVAAAAFFLGAPAGEASARAAEPAYPLSLIHI